MWTTPIDGCCLHLQIETTGVVPAAGDPAEGSGTLAAAAVMAAAAGGSELRSSSGADTAHALSQKGSRSRRKGERLQKGGSAHELVGTLCYNVSVYLLP